MKTIILSIASVFLLTNHVAAFTEANSAKHVYGTFYNTNSIVFIENQIEFAVFPDGQFDFSFFGNNRFRVGFSVNSFSFNAGFDYNPYIQYDAFGAVIQIENTPIFYDNYGRVAQIGNIGIRYNRFGRLIAVGGLNVVFRNNVIITCNGFINPFNRFYVFKPWHRYYVAPPVNYCVTYTRPYRLNYRPVRHVYYRPYTNNARLSTVNDRRSYTNAVRINSGYSDRYRQVAHSANDKQVRRDYRIGNFSRIASARTVESNRRISSSRRNSDINRTSEMGGNYTSVSKRPSSIIDSKNTGRINSRVNTSYSAKGADALVNHTSYGGRNVTNKSVTNKRIVGKKNSPRSSRIKNSNKSESRSDKTQTYSRSPKNSKGKTAKTTPIKRSSRRFK